MDTQTILTTLKLLYRSLSNDKNNLYNCRICNKYLIRFIANITFEDSEWSKFKYLVTGK